MNCSCIDVYVNVNYRSMNEQVEAGAREYALAIPATWVAAGRFL